jgi:hypothetical protein
MKKILSKLLNGVVGRIARNANYQTRDWEDSHLILAARTFMASTSWQSPLNNQSKERLYSKEFRAYSQFGDDGIIQYLIFILGLDPSSKFIEFGVGDFFESNSHFLLVNNNWSGFVMDGSDDNINKIKSSSIFWRYDLQAIATFITAENINDLISKSEFENIQYLHIDLDGNDYWVLKNLKIEKLDPDILILEYNSIFGPDRMISVPYDPKFYRFDAHRSGQYFGASLSALVQLAEEKGYYFIGCNSAGNNAYFLANKHKTIFSGLSTNVGFVDAKFRDTRDASGQLTYPQREVARTSIKGMPVINVKSGAQEIF